MAGPTNSLLATVYADDEDIAVRVGADYANLCPHDQLLAQGTDGVFLNSNQWQLSSTSNNFASQGVATGNVIRLTGPATLYKGLGNKYAVSAVSGNAVTLRNIGQLDGIGLPPGPLAGQAGVAFVIATLGPQLEDASYQLNTQYGIDPSFQLTSPAQIYDLRQLNQATALTVVCRMLAVSTRTKDGDFARKLDVFRNDLSRALDILEVRWNQTKENPPPTTRFSMKWSR